MGEIKGVGYYLILHKESSRKYLVEAVSFEDACSCLQSGVLVEGGLHLIDSKNSPKELMEPLGCHHTNNYWWKWFNKYSFVDVTKMLR